MPSSIQIVPKYSFPHEETYIHDNTGGAYDEVVAKTVTYPYICVFAASKGIDRTLVKITSKKNYYRVFGKTNFKKYGQPHLMPEAILNQTNAEVWAMRVTPDDALYANSVLSLWYKPDVENKAFYIKFTAKSITTSDSLRGDYLNMKEVLSDRAAIEEYGSLTDGVEVDGQYIDDEGFVQVPLAVFTAPGRGVYGKHLRWRISRNEEAEVDNDVKMYDFEIIDTETSAVVASTDTGAIVSSAKTSDTLFINDVIEDKATVNIGAYIKFNEDNVEKVYDAYTEFVDEIIEANPTEVVSIPELDSFDPLFGKAMRPLKSRITPNLPYIKMVKYLTADVDQDDPAFDPNLWTETEVIDISDPAGIKFNGGSDGAFADPDPAKVQAAYDKCYMDAFNGKYDKFILAPRRIRSLALFDADYSMPVKIELVRLAMYRASCPVYLDTNHQETLGSIDIRRMEVDFSGLDELSEAFDNFDEAWCCSVNTHDYFIKEPCTGRRISVTTTYFLASTDVDFRLAYGSVHPRIGKSATLSGHIRNSLRPCVAENEADLKEALYQARINYFEDEGDNVFVRGTQSMYVKSNSDLLEECNVIALFELKEEIEEQCRDNRYQITTPAKRKEFRNYLTETYGWMVGEYFDSLDFKFTSNKYESQRNIVHLYAAVTFPRRSKTTLIEIDINRAEYQADISDEEEDDAE